MREREKKKNINIILIWLISHSFLFWTFDHAFLVSIIMNLSDREFAQSFVHLPRQPAVCEKFTHSVIQA